MKEISVSELMCWQADSSRSQPLLLDVRDEWEFSQCHLEGSQLLPMALIPIRHSELPDEQAIVVICHHGIRSAQVAHYLSELGFDEVYNLAGGVDAWACLADPNMKRY